MKSSRPRLKTPTSSRLSVCPVLGNTHSAAEGTVRFSYVDPRYQERIAADLLLAAARASKD